MTFDGTLRGEVSWSRPNRRFVQQRALSPRLAAHRRRAHRLRAGHIGVDLGGGTVGLHGRRAGHPGRDVTGAGRADPVRRGGAPRRVSPAWRELRSASKCSAAAARASSRPSTGSPTPALRRTPSSMARTCCAAMCPGSWHPRHLADPDARPDHAVRGNRRSHAVARGRHRDVSRRPLPRTNLPHGATRQARWS